MTEVSPKDEIVAQRVAGATFKAIALLHGFGIGKVRYICRRAIAAGMASDAELRMKRAPKPQRIPEHRYSDHWIARVKARCVKDQNGCWIWQGFVNHKGYGYTSYRGKNVAVHRRMLEIFSGVQLRTEEFACHHCDVRRCCNPAHLFKGDNSANQLDASRKGRHQEIKKTHCPRGHAYDEANTYFAPNGARNCKICMRARMRRAAGWPSDLAYSMPAVPHGQRPVNAKNYRKRTAA